MKQGMKRAALAGSALAAALMVAGCGGLRSDAEPDRVYVLNPAAAAGAAAPVTGVLLVPRPAAQPGLDTDRIVLTRPGNELDFYAGSRWSGSLPPVLSAFVVQSLAGSFTTVSSAERGAGPGDFEVLITVRHFEAEYGDGTAAPTIRVSLECLLVSRAPRRVLGNCDAEAREPAEHNRMGAIVSAFEKASNQAVAQMRQKVLGAAAAAPARPAP